jgi:ATP:ADP antiporter, AAA family
VNDASQPRLPLRTLIALAVLAFVSMMGYALVRPPTESLFLEHYSSKSLPWVWLAGVLAAGLVTEAYVRASRGADLLRLVAKVAGTSAVLLVILLLAVWQRVPGASFVLYVWKDIYIVALVEAFWSLANSTFAERVAKWTYGLFLALGSIGGLVGNLLAGVLAREFGTQFSLFAVVPLLVGTTVVCLVLPPVGKASGEKSSARLSIAEAFGVVRASRYLWLLLGVVAVVQVSLTTIDFRFNQLIEVAYPAVDARTAVLGRVYAAIDAGALGLQLLTGVILKLVGLRGTFVAVPSVVFAATLAFVLNPTFIFAAALKITGKSFDYSLARAAKEILYIPLSAAEKVRGKAVVDIFTYRMSKGLASLLLLALATLPAAALGATLLLLSSIWLLLALQISRRERQH